MAICDKCTKLGKSSRDVFTRAERIYVLASATSMLRSVLSGRDNTTDKMVANSVITKMLLSFESGERDTLTHQLQKSTNIGITLDSCPHGVQIIQ